MSRPASLDEMVDGRGGLRPHWRGVLSALGSLGNGGLAERARLLDRAFEEEGVSSLLPGAQRAAWRCDPVPLPIPAAEFAVLEAGLAQRARLLEAVLADVYGKQALLAEGRLPPALAFANPGFLRPCHDPAHASLLHLYAADLIRGPDGAWRVAADRTAAAGGIGYARENRRILSRVLPEAFRPVQVRPLRPFFEQWQDALRRLAPEGVANPSVAVLTPGTSAPQWFEHMYLSRELGCALVEGADLTVRDGGVFLKTLRGLQPIDVLLRRIDARMIDPLELEPASLIGVPGLLETARTGRVRVANDPGTGAVEAPALAAFLPDLARRLLGENLAIPGVATLWLGEERARTLVLADPSRWLLRPALDGTVEPVSPAALEEGAWRTLMGRVLARPWEWAASAVLPASVAPCLDGEGLSPRPVMLRLFLVHDGADWRAMPGGLGRVVDSLTFTWASGESAGSGLAKDIWVLSEERAETVPQPAVRLPPLRLRRTAGDLPSRVADNLFWLGRYVERLDTAARLGRAVLPRLGRGSAMLPHETVELAVLGACLADARLVPPEGAALPGLGESMRAAMRDSGPVQTLFADIARVAESVRDRLTGDMYATLTATLRAARREAARGAAGPDALAHAMVGMRRFATAVAGLAAENMVRGGGWLFLELGRRIERGHAVAAEVAHALDQPPARIEIGLGLILELCDSAITYRSRYLNALQPAPVLDLVLADQGNPRGLAFQLAQIHALLDELADDTHRPQLAGAAAGLLAEVEMLVEGVLAAPDQAVAAAGLPGKLLAVEASLAALSDRVTRRYFALLPAVQTLGLTGTTPELRGAA